MQEIPGHGPLYAYQPLDTSREEIRLVRFADSANQSSDIRTLKRSLHLHIESFSLASVPAYTALSYTWGRTDRAKTVHVGDENGVLNVTKNLLNFLHGARLRLKKADDKKKWGGKNKRRRSNPSWYKRTAEYDEGEFEQDVDEDGGAPADAAASAASAPVEPEAWDGGWLWIDALCINQADLGERSSQVLLMKRVFECAQGIIIWLGEGGRKSDEGMELMEKFAPLAAAAARKQQPFTDEGTEEEDREERNGGVEKEAIQHQKLEDGIIRFGSEENFIEFTDDQWQAMGGVLNRSYWRRAWIVPEATTTAPFIPTDTTSINDDSSTSPSLFGIPKQQPIQVWCGQKTISFATIIAANKGAYLVRQRSDLRNVLNHEISTLELNGRRRQQYGHCGGLIELLMRMRFFKATDPRDKVYAVLPLVSDRDKVAKRLKPDYTLSVEAVYTKLAVEAIRGDGSLHIIGTAGMRRKVAVPTWVPDWSFFCGSAFGRVAPCNEGTGRSATASSNNVHESSNSDTQHTVVFKAAGDTTLSLTIDSSNRILRVRGRVIDFIAGGSMPRWTYPNHDSSVSRKWRGMARPFDAPYVNEQCTRGDAFERILTADFKIFSAVALEGQRGHRIDTRSRAGNIFEPYDMSINQATYYRRLIATRRGYLGLAAHAVKPGDFVCLFYGHPFPVVLRRKGTHWLFNGEAYIHGLMDGEAMAEDMREGKDQVFEIW